MGRRWFQQSQQTGANIGVDNRNVQQTAMRLWTNAQDAAFHRQRGLQHVRRLDAVDLGTLPDGAVGVGAAARYKANIQKTYQAYRRRRQKRVAMRGGGDRAGLSRSPC